MDDTVALPIRSSTVTYDVIISQARYLITGESDKIANAANLSALIYEFLNDISWAGFYFKKGDELVLGPFQGKPACIRIPIGRGVCGTAAATRETQIVSKVEDYPGHIYCDSAAKSEIVIPMEISGSLIGVLDIDSASYDRFCEIDKTGLEHICSIYLQSL